MDAFSDTEIETDDEGRRMAWNTYQQASRGEMLDDLLRIMENDNH